MAAPPSTPNSRPTGTLSSPLDGRKPDDFGPERPGRLDGIDELVDGDQVSSRIDRVDPAVDQVDEGPMAVQISLVSIPQKAADPAFARSVVARR